MPKTSRLSLAKIFEDYRYVRICNEYTGEGTSKSLPYLCVLAGTTPEREGYPDRNERLAKLYDRLPEKYRDQIALIENTLTDLYTIDADCEDEDFMNKTMSGIKKVLKTIPGNNRQNIEIRIKLLHHFNDLYEQLYPSSKRGRFAIMKQMVKEIKKNDGTFDHDPLNLVARSVYYFMKEIPAKERYALLLQIERKTIDHKEYDYTYIKQLFAKGCALEKEEQKLQRRETSQTRYNQIRNRDLPYADDNKTKIKLYHELLDLIKDQDWGRSQKFREKKIIYDKLIKLYQAEGMNKEALAAKEERDRFTNALNISQEAARRKGYNLKPYKPENER